MVRQTVAASSTPHALRLDAFDLDAFDLDSFDLDSFDLDSFDLAAFDLDTERALGCCAAASRQRRRRIEPANPRRVQERLARSSWLG